MVDPPLSPDEQTRLRRCRLVTYGLPILAAAVSLSVIAGERHMPFRQRLWFVLPAVIVGNGLLAAAAAVAAVVRLHPVQTRRWQAGVIALLVTIPLYLIAYVGLALLGDRVVRSFDGSL